MDTATSHILLKMIINFFLIGKSNYINQKKKPTSFTMGTKYTKELQKKYVEGYVVSLIAIGCVYNITIETML